MNLYLFRVEVIALIMWTCLYRFSGHHVIAIQQIKPWQREYNWYIAEWITAVYTLLAFDFNLCCNSMDCLSYLLQFSRRWTDLDGHNQSLCQVRIHPCWSVILYWILMAVFAFAFCCQCVRGVVGENAMINHNSTLLDFVFDGWLDFAMDELSSCLWGWSMI